MSEIAVKAVPRRGRFFVIAIFALLIFGCGYLVVEVATQEPGEEKIEAVGVNDAQRIFGGVRQEGDRIGFSDAPVTIQVFSDVQCAGCREDFLETMPTLVEDQVRSGDVKMLWRNYSNSENVYQLGFYGVEAAAEQNYAWQYIYLFFRSLDEVPSFGVDDEFLEAVALGIGELDLEQWKEDLERGGGPEGAITQRLDQSEELGRDLGIRTRQAAIVSGPGGTVTLQDGAGLAEIEAAIAEVE